MPLKLNPITGTFDQVLAPGHGVATIQVDGNTGSATPTSAGVITIAGSSDIATAATGNTLTISLATPLYVPSGGTGRATLTDGAILIGDGTDPIEMIGPLTDGQILIGDTAGISPVAATLTAGGGIDITNAPGSITIAIDDPLDVVYGGTGAATLTDGGIILGSGVGAVTVTAQPADGELLIGSTGIDPVLANLTAGGGITIVNGAGTITVEIDDPLDVAYGGTGAATLTDHGILLGSGVGAITATAEPSDGQLLVGSTGNDPVLTTLTAGEAVDITNAAGSITLSCEDWSETNKGVGELATDAEAIAGASSVAAIVPTSLKAKLGAQTQYTVAVGATDAAALAWVGPGSAGQVLQSGGAGANPAYSTATYPLTSSQGDLLLSSSDNTITVLAKDTNATRYLSNTGANNNAAWAQVNLANGVTGTLPIGNGGTGDTSFTDHGVLLGSGAGSITATAAPTDGQLLIGHTGADPDLATLTDGSGITITEGAGTITVAMTDPVTVSIGGTGAQTFTDGGILLGSGTNPFTVTAQPTNGQLLIGSTGNDPVLSTLTEGSNITITEGAGTITIAAAISDVTWSTVTDAAKTIVVSEGYVGNRGTDITYTLPATSALYDIFEITNIGAGMTVIAQGANQYINVVNSTTTVGAGGSLTATDQFASIKLICIEANLGWNTLRHSGSWTIV